MPGVSVAKFVPRSYYDYEADPGTVNEEPSMTKQAPAAEHDINVIMRGYVTPPALSDEHLALLGSFGDVSEIGDFQGCVNRVQEANAAFLELPARVRDRFANDPARFLGSYEAAELGDEESVAELMKLGVWRATESSSPGTVPGAPAAPEAPVAAAAGAPAPKA